MGRSFFVVIGIILLIFSIVMYFVLRGGNENNIVVKVNKLHSDLVVAKDKLKKEKQKLEIMEKELKATYPLVSDIQEKMKKVSVVVRQTDYLFADSVGLNPELIIKNILSSASINNERKNINLLISRWERESDILNIPNMGIFEVERIRKDTEAIKTFIENLFKIISDLTPENSGLSQNQIDIYSLKLPSLDTVNDVLYSLNSAIGNFQKDLNLTNSGSSSSLENIVHEQSVVQELENNITNIQNQIDSIEQQNQQNAQIENTIIPVENTNNPTVNNPNILNGFSGGEDDYVDPHKIDRSKYQGIIIQPGPPKLIEGINQF